MNNSNKGHFADPNNSSPIVIYIGGLGRSGSTLLAELLATLPGFVSVGELPTLWRHGWRDDWQSSDGHQFSNSPVWTSLVARLEADDPDFCPEDAFQLCENTLRRRHWIALGARRSVCANTALQTKYTEHFSKVYRILANETGAQIIVDSGKSPFHAALMSNAKDLDFRSIHLIRDPRAVAFSRLRKKINRNSTSGQPVLMARQGSIRIALRWSWQNILMHRQRLRAQRTTKSHCEVLAKFPAAEINRILSDLGVPYDQSALLPLRSGAFVKQPGIAFSGNSSRFNLSETAIKPDDAWRRDLSWWSYAVVSVLTYPVRVWLECTCASKSSARTKA